MAYKAETDDVRESPSVQVAEILKAEGYEVRQYDPFVDGHGYTSLVEVAKGADLLAVLVPHAGVLEKLRHEENAIKAAMRTPRLMIF